MTMKPIFEGWRRFVNEAKEEKPIDIWRQALKAALQKETIEEAEHEEKADVDIEIMPFKPEEESGFCLYNPKINAFALESPESLAETILFVFGTMQTPWPKFVPYFRFVADMAQDGKDIGEFVSNMDKSQRATVIRQIYLDKNGINEEDLTDEQELYLEKAVSAVVMMASTPKASTYNTIWQTRGQIYEDIAPLLQAQEGGPKDLDSTGLLNLYTELLKLPGLGKAKAGFTVQMLTGKMGCIDSIWSKIWNATDPAISGLITQTLKGQAKGTEKNIRKHAQRYIDMLKAIKDGSGMGSKELWDAWTEQVAIQMKNPGRNTFDYKLRDEKGNVILTGRGKYTYQAPKTKKGQPSQTEPYYTEKRPQDKDAQQGGIDVSREHDPRQLGYIRENN